MDEFGQTYIYSKETRALAYFINNSNSFYFTSFYGDENSLLYYFHLAAYKILFSENDNMATDAFPLQLYPNKFKLWLQDIIAPFYRHLSLGYQSNMSKDKAGLVIKSSQFTNDKQEMDASIVISENSIQEFDVNIKQRHIKVQWV